MKDIMKIVKSLEEFGLLISSENNLKENKTTKRWIPWYAARYFRCKFIR